jgi:hypothetical protein
MIDPRDSLRDLERQLAELPLAGLCFHDADHGYLAQYFEFSCLWSHLTETGVFVGDDIDGSFAMIDFCRARDIEPDVLVDGRKAIGVIPRSPSR